MDLVLNGSLITVGFLSFIPVFKLFNTQKSGKYRCLRYLIFITFIWTIITFLEQLLQTGLVVYYIHMLTFPVKFALSGMLFVLFIIILNERFLNICYTVFHILIQQADNLMYQMN
jgi:hypothetical protein